MLGRGEAVEKPRGLRPQDPRLLRSPVKKLHLDMWTPSLIPENPPYACVPGQPELPAGVLKAENLSTAPPPTHPQADI